MATFTTAQMLAAGVPAASTDAFSTPGDVTFEYILDGSKKAIATSDVVNVFDIPTYTGVVISGAAVSVSKAGTASGALSVCIGTTDVTGLTAFDTATVGESVKLATAANTVVTTGTAGTLAIKMSTAGLGSGIIRVRIFAEVLKA
jgi:hypothetical protein